MLAACAHQPQQAAADREPTVITWIADKPGPTLQPHKLYPEVPDSLWRALGLQEGVPSGMNCFLLQTEGKKILFDAGLGAPFSQLVPKLKELGTAPEELRLIYVTHLHPDHIGGLLKEGQVVFPKAEVYVNRVEAEAWQTMEGERSRLAKSVLEAYKERLHLFEAGDTLEGGVLTLAAYGHTPGHTVFQKDSILVIADLIHGAALQLEHPEYCPTYDMDAAAARESRLRLLKYAREHHLTLYGMHLPAPGFLPSTATDGQDRLTDNYGACLYVDGEATGVRTDEPFAMHSLMKFPQAIFVAACLKQRSIPLHETLAVKKEELVQSTWSPMLKMFDRERDFSYAELLELSLAQSDNNACDLLFRRFGGPEKVEEYLQALGFTEIHLRWTEREMGLHPQRSADNNCTPKGLARLFDWFYHHKEQDEYFRFVWDTMSACQTGAERITSVIPKGAVFVHKTGTGFPTQEHRQDRNDAGVLIMPDGTYRILAVFVPHCLKEADVATIGHKLIKKETGNI